MSATSLCHIKRTMKTGTACSKSNASAAANDYHDIKVAAVYSTKGYELIFTKHKFNIAF